MVHVLMPFVDTHVITCTKIKIEWNMKEEASVWQESVDILWYHIDREASGQLVSSFFQPFYGGKKHRVTSEIFAPNEKKPIVTIDGEWNGVMYAKYATGVRSLPLYMFVYSGGLGTFEDLVRNSFWYCNLVLIVHCISSNFIVI